MNKNILIIEDERELNNVLYEYLTNEGYNVSQAFDGIEGLLKFNHTINLIIVDVMMPRLDGYGVLSEIRKKSNVPVLMLTALSEEENIIKGYDFGVDEYVTKPFSPKIIVKKVNAILNRQLHEEPTQIIQKGVLKIDLEKMEVCVREERVNLTKKEFDLLHILAENENKVFSRDKLLNKVWGYDYFGEDRVVDTCVKRLRKKLNEAKDYFKTVFGVGYKFEVSE